MSRRADIEESGREYRWEFDRRKLFGRSDYMINVCTDMQDVIHLMREYNTMFGPEIKSTVSDQKHLDFIIEAISKLPDTFKVV